MQFANRGYSIASPSALAALRAAARDVAKESAKIKVTPDTPKRLATPLSQAVGTEAQVLRNASTFRHARSDEELLISALQRRATAARVAQVHNCAGPAPGTIRPSAPAS